MFERILVTGCTGFVGPWMLAELRKCFPRALLYGTSRNPPPVGSDHALERHACLDLCDSLGIEALIAEVRPDAVVHLASLRHGSLEALLEVNVLGLDRLLGSLERQVPQARIVVVGSSAELGRAAEQDLPLGEGMACQPADFYGLTKQAQSALAYLRALRGQQVVRLRPFNLLGPGMPDSLLAGRCARLLRQAADTGSPLHMEFGPLDTRRDYVDVRDLARAVVMALENGVSGALYHIGSGKNLNGHELVKALIAITKVEQVSYSARESADAMLVPFQTADARLACQVLQWTPNIDWKQSLLDLWESTCLSNKVARRVREFP